MLAANRFALKEWAVVADALTAGRQLILLRKGGIEEEGGEFRVEHREFFLYPTFEHQNRRFLRPEFLPTFDRAVAEQPRSEDLIISGYAVVADCVLAKEVEKLRLLSPHHLWNDDYIRMRFNYKPKLPLYVLLLRVYRTPAVRVAYRAEYRGCKSWVELDRELATAGAHPALDDVAFESRRQELKRLLGLPTAAGTPTQPVKRAVQ
jgi:hypothetical protein